MNTINQMKGAGEKMIDIAKQLEDTEKFRIDRGRGSREGSQYGRASPFLTV